MDDQGMFGMTPENARPPAEVRFESMRAEAQPDGRRVRVFIELTPFRERPNLVVGILDRNDEEVARVDIVETMNYRMVFTMHLQIPETAGSYRLKAVLSYEQTGDIDQAETAFEIPANG